MDIKTKYNLGDSVYYVVGCTDAMYEDCPACNGQGYIIQNGNRFNCTCCYGAKITKYKSIFNVRRSSIGQIDLEIREDKTVESYMLKATGIGSGTNWKVDELFSKKEEADAYCNKLNEQ